MTTTPKPDRDPRGQVPATNLTTTQTVNPGQAPTSPFASPATATKGPDRGRSRSGVTATGRPPDRPPAPPTGGRRGQATGSTPFIPVAARLNTRKANPHPCRHCGQPTLVGLDADLLAGTATINPQPITVDQEVAEWTAGRRTYMYSTLSREIDFRDHHRILGRPAWHGDTHPTHTCKTLM